MEWLRASWRWSERTGDRATSRHGGGEGMVLIEVLVEVGVRVPIAFSGSVQLAVAAGGVALLPSAQWQKCYSGWLFPFSPRFARVQIHNPTFIPPAPSTRLSSRPPPPLHSTFVASPRHSFDTMADDAQVRPRRLQPAVPHLLSIGAVARGRCAPGHQDNGHNLLTAPTA